MKKIYSLIMFILLSTSFSVYAEQECKREFTIYLRDGSTILSKVPVSYKKGSFYIMNAKIPTGKGIFAHVIRYDQGKIFAINRIKYTNLSLTINSDKGEVYYIGKLNVDDNGSISIGKGKFKNMNFDKTGNVFHLMLDVVRTNVCKIEAVGELYVSRLEKQGSSFIITQSISMSLKTDPISF